MPRKFSIVCLFVAWLCASGAMLDVAQVFAWTRMFATYAQSLPVGEAAVETLDGSKPCPICLAVRRARANAKDPQTPGVVRSAEKMILSLSRAEPVVFAPERETWPPSIALTAESRPSPVPVPPPRVANLVSFARSLPRRHLAGRPTSDCLGVRAPPSHPFSKFCARITMKTVFSLSSTTVVCVATLASVVLSIPPALGCSECGCSLSSDWSAQGYPDLPGFQTSIRYEYYDSHDLRHGAHRFDRPAVGDPADVEIQRETLNRNTWLGLDYVGAHAWAVSVQLPHYDRYHSTTAEGDTEVSESRTAGIGDLRLLVRHQNFSMYRSIGFQFGLKLPTGGFAQNFATGPQAGTLLDRGLQLGSGTTDLLAGVSYFRRPTANIGWFGQLTADLPVRERSGFLPSANLGANTGIRYLNPTSITPQLQLNVRWDSRERGANADTPNSGGIVAYVSPGATVELGRQSTAFVFLQLPVYRRVNGLQLEPHSLLSLGVSWKI